MDTATDDLFLAGDTVYDFGVDLGLCEVAYFIGDLAEKLTPEQWDKGFADGVNDTCTTAGEGMTRDNNELERDDYDPQVSFTARDLLLQAAATIRDEGRQEGHAAAIQAIRTWYDNLSDDLGKHYYEGVLYAHDQVVAAFNADPQPRWEPYDPPEDPEDEE